MEKEYENLTPEENLTDDTAAENGNTVTIEAESDVNDSGNAVEGEDELHGENLTDRVKVLSPTMTVLKRFFRSKLSVVGLVTLIALFLFSFIGPLFSPYTDTTIDYSKGKENVSNTKLEYVVDGEAQTAYFISVSQPSANIKADPSGKHWMGTDEFGRDLMTRLMYGGQISLTISLIVIFLETLLGVILGGLAGYFGGWVDQLIMRIVDILYCVPQLPIMLILSAMFTSLGIEDISRLYYMMGILTLMGWAGTARLVRGQILSLREQEFMLAAKCAGLSTKRKIFKHLIPNVLPQLIVSMTLGLGSIILTEATLGFLGLGAPLGTATWGSMINYATKSEYLNSFPNFWVPAGICITLAILAFNFVGDGLRDAFDPKAKR